MNIAVSTNRQEKIKAFLWQHLLLLVSLDMMTAGVVLCIKSALGSSVILSLPYVFSIAGADGLARLLPRR